MSDQQSDPLAFSPEERRRLIAQGPPATKLFDASGNVAYELPEEFGAAVDIQIRDTRLIIDTASGVRVILPIPAHYRARPQPTKRDGG